MSAPTKSVYQDEFRRLIAQGWTVDEALDHLNRVEWGWMQIEKRLKQEREPHARRIANG